MTRSCCWLEIIGVVAVALAGCERGSPRIAAPETPVVPVSHPEQREVKDYVYYTGRANAKNAVTIQPRVTGYLMKMPFKEGADVKKGDVLFEIDPSPYEAQLKAAKAAVAQNEANVRYARATNLRFKELDKKQKGAVSQRELDQYQAQEDQALANLDLARANLDSARLNLDWTTIRAPIDGTVSRYFLTVGNLVNQDATQLTTLVSMDPMYVYFDMDEPTLLRIRRALNDGRIARAKEGTGVPIQISLPGEDGYPNAGTTNFVDNQINPGTGSISVRGVLANPRPKGGAHLIVPGMFVRVRLPIGQPTQELLVIDRAVTSNQGLKYVYVLDKDKKVEERRVTLGSLQDDGMRVVTQGLKKDDWVLIGGLQQVRPRMLVQPDYLQKMPTLAEPALPKAKKG